jgi:hypothetical protein
MPPLELPPAQLLLLWPLAQTAALTSLTSRSALTVLSVAQLPVTHPEVVMLRPQEVLVASVPWPVEVDSVVWLQALVVLPEVLEDRAVVRVVSALLPAALVVLPEAQVVLVVLLAVSPAWAVEALVVLVVWLQVSVVWPEDLVAQAAVRPTHQVPLERQQQVQLEQEHRARQAQAPQATEQLQVALTK